jgi:hypothetical protein
VIVGFTLHRLLAPDGVFTYTVFFPVTKVPRVDSATGVPGVTDVYVPPLLSLTRTVDAGVFAAVTLLYVVVNE